MKKLFILFVLGMLVGFTKFQDNSALQMQIKKTESKWGVPAALQIAIINHPSSLKSKAKADSTSKFPNTLQHTWESFQKDSGSKGRRNEFAAATDFISGLTLRS